jgi:3-oxoadipate enol-lactonase
MTTVYLHPIGLDRDIWAGVAADDAILLDLPGHGSAPLEGPVTFEGVADYVARHLDDRCDVVGLSVGAMIAQHVALRHPEVVRSLVLAAGGPGGGGGSAVSERAQQTREVGMAGMLASTLERWFTADALATPGHPGVSYATNRLLADDPEVFASYWDAMAEHDLVSRVGNLTVPVTVIAGSVDKSGPVPRMQQFAALMPGAEFEVVEGPHMIPLENPEGFAAVVTRHLERVDRR